MAYPTTIDAPRGTAAQGTTLLSSVDHSLDHRTLGSAVISIENKLGIGSGSAAANQILVGSGAGSSAWGTVWNQAQLGTPTITGGTATSFTNNNATLGTPSVTGGTYNNGIFGTPSITGGTETSSVFNGNTVNYQILGSMSYSPGTGGTATLQLGSAVRHLVNMPNSAGSVTLAVAGQLANMPFFVEILQGTAGLGTIGWWTTIRYQGTTPYVAGTIASRKDSYGFICTGTASGGTYDSYIVGTNLG